MKYIEVPDDLREMIEELDVYKELQELINKKGVAVCAYCGTPNLIWRKNIHDKWRLWNGRELHRCKEREGRR